MVRKVTCFLAVLVLITASFAVSAQAATHNIYDEGTLSSTYVTYFKDIVSGIGFKDNYVAFRSGQYSYTMVVGEMELQNNTVTLKDTGTIYTFTTASGYNANTSYTHSEINNFSLVLGDSIVYSDLGNYPQLMERGAKYEMLSAVLLFVIVLLYVLGRIFGHS